MERRNHGEIGEIGIATFGDHVYAYLSNEETRLIAAGTPVTILLTNHPAFDRLEIVPDDSLSIGRGMTNHFPEIRTIGIMVGRSNFSSEKNEINVEIGGDRNYVFRLEGWKNEFSDWKFSVEMTRKKVGNALGSTH